MTEYWTSLGACKTTGMASPQIPGNMDNDEIAKVLNITEGTIRQRLSRGKIMI